LHSVNCPGAAGDLSLVRGAAEGGRGVMGGRGMIPQGERRTLMTAIRATVKNGKIELDAPSDWPEGTEVLIEPVPHAASLALRDEHGPNTPEGIAQLLASIDRIEPLILTAEEEAEWEAARKARKGFERFS